MWPLLVSAEPQDYVRGALTMDISFSDELEIHIRELLNKGLKKSWFSCAVTHNAHPSIRDGIIAIGYPGTVKSTKLPCRVPEKNLFPSEQILHFMGLKELPTKRAKPQDWIDIAEEFARKVKAEVNAE